MAEEEERLSKHSEVLTFRHPSKMPKKIVLKLELNCEKCKRRAMKTLAGIEGVDSIKIDAKESKIIIIGDADPVCLTASLRKFGFVELVSVGPPEKEPEQKGSKHGKTDIILPISCDRGYSYYFSEHNPNDCSIL